MKNIQFIMDKKIALLAAVLLTTGMSSGAQTLPPVDAGAVLQQVSPGSVAPAESNFTIEYDGDASQESQSGGPVAELKQIRFTGNTVFNEAHLLAALGDVLGKSYDFSGFQKISNQVSQFYRANGYPFARALIPQQSMKDGELTIQVLEGRYGEIRVKSADSKVQSAVQAYLSDLKPGDPIASKPLERVVLTLNDLPGVTVVPVVGPGAATGSGNLTVIVKEEDQRGGELTLDNHGARYTGYNRVGVAYKASHVANFGDEIDLRGMLSDEQMLFGRASYAFPLAPNGLRGSVSYSRTQYQLGKDFAALDAVGTADQFRVGVAYPLIRSQRHNLSVSAALQHSDLTDEFRATDVRLSKSSTTLPVSISFNSRDQFLSGGLFYGSLMYTAGSLRNPTDFANTVGQFGKTNLEIARVQGLGKGFSLFVKHSMQSASKNLDSSEDLFLGGANGVRAYPQGEAAGDEGHVSSVELRYQWGNASPYVFYDRGRVATFARPTSVLISETRTLSGAGIGVRYSTKHWNVDVAAAWRKVGGQPRSDLFQDPKPRWMLSVAYRF